MIENTFQAPVVRNYPAKLSLTSFTCFFGLIQFMVIAAFFERDPNKWKIKSGEEIFTIIYAVSMVISTHFFIDMCHIMSTLKLYLNSKSRLHFELVVLYPKFRY